MKHYLVLHNDTDTAWTTGPYLAVSNGRPLSEDLLRYTPKGGRCEIPVTAAVNIAHERSETEISRKLKAHSPRHDVHLDLVTVEGTARLRNFEKTEIRVVVEVPISGKPILASGKGQTRVDTTKLKLTERTGSVSWEIKLKPDETKSLTYRYERYVPSN